MDSKDIKSIINPNEEFEFGCKVASKSSDDTENNSRPRRDETRGGGDGNETCDGTRAPTNSTPFAFKSVVDDDPSEATDGGGKISDDASHARAEVAAKGTATIESEPTEPEENCAKNDVGHVVGSVVELVGSMATSLAQHDGISESRCTG